MVFKDNRFDTIKDIKINATVELRKIPSMTFIVVSSNDTSEWSGAASVCVLTKNNLKLIK